MVQSPSINAHGTNKWQVAIALLASAVVGQTQSEQSFRSSHNSWMLQQTMIPSTTSHLPCEVDHLIYSKCPHVDHACSYIND